ncbi:AraC family transcriptional regulator [Wenyingzhuangia aestuarii]|uniref:AraC family transcriptional regulator n=1 Tax=Wenyingzhuangia aestuarii TaxID=1647582 RepID=UPI00143A5E75|nr:AraC family transcriptional regulator [Wenyingzhuangia aestuarii]NJB82774.1 AraC-like DNA-binding protein [Wenyingzhuangia aestuarii]
MYKIVENLSLSLLNTGYVNLDKRWNYENVMSPFFRMYYVTDGEAKVFHQNKEYVLKQGYMYLIPSFTYSHYKCDEHMTQYYISAIEISETGHSVFSSLNFIYEVKADHISLVYFKRLLELNPNRSIVRDDPKVYDNEEGLTSFKTENKKLSEGAYLETSGLLKSILSKFVVTYKKENTLKDDKSKLRDVVNFIEINLHTNITVKQLADTQNLNVDYFSRLFKSIYHIRPNEYIQKKRVERAQLLLIASSNSLQQVSDTVGFSNVSYFSRVFKKYTNSSPLQYRKEGWKM